MSDQWQEASEALDRAIARFLTQSIPSGGERVGPLTVETIQRFIDELTGERPKLVMVVPPADYPRMSGWADRLRDACNIVEIKPSAFCPDGQAIVMVHPDEIPKISYPMQVHRPRLPSVLNLSDPGS